VTPEVQAALEDARARGMGTLADHVAALEGALYETMLGWLESEGRPTTRENVQRQVDDAVGRAARGLPGRG
jgi:hypothetical protein